MDPTFPLTSPFPCLFLPPLFWRRFCPFAVPTTTAFWQTDGEAAALGNSHLYLALVMSRRPRVCCLADSKEIESGQ